MNKKFLIFMNNNMEFSIHLAMVNFHKNIEIPSNATAICGGGWWDFEPKSGILRLYGKSEDFGEYNKKEAQEAFDNQQVFYFGEECFEDYEMKQLIMD